MRRADLAEALIALLDQFRVGKRRVFLEGTQHQQAQALEHRLVLRLRLADDTLDLIMMISPKDIQQDAPGTPETTAAPER